MQERIKEILKLNIVTGYENSSHDIGYCAASIATLFSEEMKARDELLREAKGLLENSKSMLSMYGRDEFCDQIRDLLTKLKSGI